jgi:hypothetical protein
MRFARTGADEDSRAPEAANQPAQAPPNPIARLSLKNVAVGNTQG